MAVLLQINIIPIGKEGASLSDALLEVAREMHEVCFAQGYPRVVTSIRIDDRRDKDLNMQYKTQTVAAKLDKH